MIDYIFVMSNKNLQQQYSNNNSNNTATAIAAATDYTELKQL